MWEREYDVDDDADVSSSDLISEQITREKSFTEEIGQREL